MKVYRISSVLVLAGAIVAASLGPVLASAPSDPATTAPASLRATGATAGATGQPTTAPTSRPFISQAEAYAIKEDNAELKKEIKQLRIEVAKLAANQAPPRPKAMAGGGGQSGLDVDSSNGGRVPAAIIGEGGQRH